MAPRTRQTRKKATPKEPREVVRVIDSREIVLAWAAAEKAGHVEVRERKDGTWTVHYPEAGWIGCFPDCKKRHTHETERPFTQVNAVFTDPQEAVEIAYDYSGLREVKIVPLARPTPIKLPSQLVGCGGCGVEFDRNNSGASYSIEPYDKRRKKLRQEGYLCDDCADRMPGKVA